MNEKAESKFWSLAELIIEERHSVSVLASAIEENGIQGWDRFGRFKTFGKTDALSVQALNALEAQYKWQCGNDDDSLSPVEQHDSLDVGGFQMGWLKGNLPDFNSISTRNDSNPLQPTKQHLGYHPEAMHCIIGGLLMFIRGELAGAKKKHPEYTTQTVLAKLMADELKGYPGLGMRNIENKFGVANKAISNPN